LAGLERFYHIFCVVFYIFTDFRVLSKMANPYEQLPDIAFWRPSVAERNPLELEQVWVSKFPIGRSDKIVTAGSCFAQHIGRELVRAGYSWCDAEPAPRILSDAARTKFNYGVFSWRTGNIYSAALLLQWLRWASGLETPSGEFWHQDGRCLDPFRPTVEPGGFVSQHEMFATRTTTMAAIVRSIREADVFIFTLGLTETWINRRDGQVYPMCPGTAGGEFNAELHIMQNGRFIEILTSLDQAFDLMKRINPGIRFILTVSPVPLTATASGDHVLVATIHSKSVLRAVAGELAQSRGDTDYFPSYEMISSFPFRGMFYQPNLRTVTDAGVAFVLRTFFAGIQGPEALRSAATADAGPRRDIGLLEADSAAEELICDEILLDAFHKVAAA
jgi:hypothetical protein